MAALDRKSEPSSLSREMAREALQSAILLNLFSFIVLLALGIGSEVKASLWIWVGSFGGGLVHRGLRAGSKHGSQSRNVRRFRKLCAAWCGVGLVLGWALVATSI